MPTHPEFNQPDLVRGASATILHPVVLAAMLLTIVLLLWRPRKYGLVSLLLSAFLIPRGQEIYVGGAHLYVSIIILVVGFVRVALAKFKIAGGFNEIDKIFIVWAVFRAFAATVTNWPSGTMEQASVLLESFCGYFLFRYLINSEEELIRAAKTLVVVAAILASSMVYEYSNYINLFGTYLGGADTAPIIRDGTARAQATFGHAILAGCFGATLIPLFVWLWKIKQRAAAVIGIAGATVMVFTAYSSTPVLGYAAGIIALLMWFNRRSMRRLRWGIVVGIVCLAIGMQAPVWFVIARINVIGGSGGYDRAYLIDTCIKHFKDWWFLGTSQFSGWGIDMWDLSNQFVAEAETGGLITLALFIAIISRSFSRLGRMRKRAEPREQWLCWCLGCVMLAHISVYFGVSYFDQSEIWWFAFLAMISATTAPLNHPVLSPLAAASVKGSVGFVRPALAKPPNLWGAEPAVQKEEVASHWMLGR